MGAVGSSADNALAESFNATLKREVLQDAACWSDEPACRRQVFTWLTRFNTRRRHSWCGLAWNDPAPGVPASYNTRRRHSWCGHLSPTTYEARRAATFPTTA